MVRTDKFLVWFFTALVLCSFAYAYEVVGDSVLYTGQYAGLEVTPHTAFSPVNDFEQVFTVTNKVNVSANLCIAYYFNEPLSKGTIKLKTMQSYNEDVWISNITCNDVWDEVNGTYYPSCIDNGHYETVQKERTVWNDVTSYFEHRSYDGRHYYYSDTPLSFDAYDIREWNIKYSPNENDDSNKWGLLGWNSKSGNCYDDFLTKNYDFLYDLDPWWNTSFDYRKGLNITNNNASEVLAKWYTANFTIDTTGSKFQDDCDDLRIVYNGSGSEVELDRVVTSCNSSNTVVEFALQANISTSSTSSNEYWVYYGNSGASAPTVNKSQVYLTYCDFTSDTCELTINAGGGEVTHDTTSGLINLTGDATTDTYLYRVINGSTHGAEINDYEYRFDLKVVSGVSNAQYFGGTGDSMADSRQYTLDPIDGDWARIDYSDGIGAYHTNPTNQGAGSVPTVSSWLYYTFVKQDVLSITAYNNTDRTLLYTSTQNTQASADPKKYFFAFNENNAGSSRPKVYQLDNVLLKRRVSNLPTYTLGSEETTSAKADESEARSAIISGINNVLSSPTIYTDRQVYVRYYNGSQMLGRFDKIAVSGDQRWAFNYIVGSDTYTNMWNLTPAFYVLEMANLTAPQITSQVEDLINNTKT